MILAMVCVFVLTNAATEFDALASPNSLKTIRLGDRGDSVRAIQQALASRGYLSGAIDGVFGQETQYAVRKFQQDNALIADGIVGKETAGILLGSAANLKPAKATQSQSKADSTAQQSSGKSAASSTQVSNAKGSQSKTLDWFSKGKNLIRSNRNIKIYDINTGTTWDAKYINGSNHADIIPASAADAKKITSNKIEGSYMRRPVIATIAGTNYAGSMYAVAHGETNYCDYFNGVMCLHFTGSQTHSSQKVDADHQKAIEIALNRTY